MYSRLLLFPSLVLLVLGPSCKGNDAAPVGSTAAVADGSTVSAAAVAPSASAAVAAAPPDGPAFEGAISMRMTHGASTPHDITMLTKGNKIRVDIPTRDGVMAHSIFDSNTGRALMILDNEKMTMSVDLPGSATALQGPPPSITRLGKHETIAGRDCEDWNVVEAVGDKHEQLCVTEGIVFLDFTTIAPGGTMGDSMGTWLGELRAKREFPLRSVRLDSAGKEESRMEVTKIEAKPIDDALFVAPKGYGHLDVGKMGIQNRLLPPTHPR